MLSETAHRASLLIHHPVAGTGPTSARWWGGKARCCGMSRQEEVVPCQPGGAPRTLVVPPGTGRGCRRQAGVGKQKEHQSLGTFVHFPVIIWTKFSYTHRVPKSLGRQQAEKPFLGVGGRLVRALWGFSVASQQLVRVGLEKWRRMRGWGIRSTLTTVTPFWTTHRVLT